MKYLLIILLLTSCVMTLEKDNVLLEKEYPYTAIEHKRHKMKSLDKKIDEAWALLVKLRAGNKCEYCKREAYLSEKGRKVGMQAHHVFGRRKRSTRWDLSNGVCLCPSHHVFSTEFSAHQTMTLFTDWIKEHRGEDWYDALLLQSNTHLKLTKLEKENILFTFTEIIKNYETKNNNN